MKSQVTALSVYGLKDLIADITPTLSGWTANPTDAVDITDGDISTFCTTGNKVAGGAWQPAEFEWDLGGIYNVLASLVGHAATTAGYPALIIYFWDGSNWIKGNQTMSDTAVRHNAVMGGFCSKIKITISASAAATITPNIREFNVWRLQ